MKKDTIVTCKAWFWLITFMLYILVMAVPTGIIDISKILLSGNALSLQRFG